MPQGNEHEHEKKAADQLDVGLGLRGGNVGVCCRETR